MAAPSLLTEAALASNYPAHRFGARERKLLQSVQEYVESLSSHQVIAAGEFTTVGGDANEAITVTGAASTDLALVTLKTAGAVPRTILTAAAASDAINLVFSGDPDDDHVVTYVLYRANS